MLKAVQSGWTPPEYIEESLYRDIRENQDNYPPYLVGFVGFGCSFSGKWFGGFARNISKDALEAEILNKTTRNYCAESQRNLLKQDPRLRGIEFYNKNYWELEIPNYSIIYCDPPYFGTTGYKNKFDHDKFWIWAENMVKNGHKVFVSEYNAPANWQCV